MSAGGAVQTCGRRGPVAWLGAGYRRCSQPWVQASAGFLLQGQGDHAPLLVVGAGQGREGQVAVVLDCSRVLWDRAKGKGEPGALGRHAWYVRHLRYVHGAGASRRIGLLGPMADQDTGTWYVLAGGLCKASVGVSLCVRAWHCTYMGRC